VVTLGRTLRSAHDLKVRQPLRKMHVACRNEALRASIAELQDIILDELNVKEVEFLDRESAFAKVKAKANFVRLGPRLGPLMKKAAGVVAGLPAEQVERLTAGETVSVLIDGQTVDLTAGDVVVEYLPLEGSVVAAEGGLVVALDKALTPELVEEGLAREFVNKLQNMRKTADLEVTQRIRVQFTGDGDIRRAVARHRDHILTETLSLACEAVDSLPDGATDWDLNGHACTIRFTFKMAADSPGRI
jgi:isoleucyl-tRNA synthetase